MYIYLLLPPIGIIHNWLGIISNRYFFDRHTFDFISTIPLPQITQPNTLANTQKFEGLAALMAGFDLPRMARDPKSGEALMGSLKSLLTLSQAWK